MMKLQVIPLGDHTGTQAKGPMTAEVTYHL